MSLPPVDQKPLTELLDTLMRLREVDGRLYRLHAARLPRLSPRARHRTQATLRMLDRAMPLTDHSIRKLESAIRRSRR
ncbi:MAG: hypothetical protein WCI95_12280 [bacterium]